MSTFLDNWLARRAMSAANGGAIIYQLRNHTCDGTAATCINTGLKIFSDAFIQAHPKFQIEISFTANQNNDAKAHVIRCCDVNYPYCGYHVRVANSLVNYQIHFQYRKNSFFEQQTTQNQYTIQNLIMRFDFINSVFEVKNRNGGSDEVFSFSRDSSILQNEPFIIGGSVINGVDETDGWKETWIGTIDSLIIKDVA